MIKEHKKSVGHDTARQGQHSFVYFLKEGESISLSTYEKEKL